MHWYLIVFCVCVCMFHVSVRSIKLYPEPFLAGCEGPGRLPCDCLIGRIWLDNSAILIKGAWRENSRKAVIWQTCGRKKILQKCKRLEGLPGGLEAAATSCSLLASWPLSIFTSGVGAQMCESLPIAHVCFSQNGFDSKFFEMRPEKGFSGAVKGLLRASEGQCIPSITWRLYTWKCNVSVKFLEFVFWGEVCIKRGFYIWKELGIIQQVKEQSFCNYADLRWIPGLAFSSYDLLQFIKWLHLPDSGQNACFGKCSVVALGVTISLCTLGLVHFTLNRQKYTSKLH